MAATQNGVDMEVSTIARWYDGRSIFITGATGFMGKVLVEKLLSSCPGITKIYLLMRTKKNQSPEIRLDQLKETAIFDRIRQSYPSRLDKLVIVNGDITLPELGLSSLHQQLLSDVSVVFHSAATVKFDEALKLSVSMNIMGTKRLLQICKSLTKLEAFVHVSTAYSNCDVPRVEERVYAPPARLGPLVAACDCLDDDIMEDVTKKLIGKRPNTYTFTKAMAEHALLECGGSFPMAIIRPSIVTAALESPLPGWVDNINGPTGLLAGAGKGILRTLYCKRDFVADIIPVDLAINTLITVAWQTATENFPGVKVYNCTTGLQNPIQWGQIEKWGHDSLVKHPFDDVLWYPGGSFKGNKNLNTICLFLFQMVPAYMVDYFAWMLGKKPAMSMVRIQNKMKVAINSLEYFTTHQWTFPNYNVQNLLSKMSAADKKLFNFDVKKINWESYIDKYVIGTRKYVLKEQDKNIPKAKSHLKKMYVLHIVTQLVVVFLFVRSLLTRSEVARSVTLNAVRLSFMMLDNCLQYIKGQS